MELEDAIGKEKGYLEVVFGPRWRYVSIVRSFIQNFLAISLDNKTKADQIAIATSELIENAIKYATREVSRIQLEIFRDEGILMTTIENFSNDEHIQEFKNEYDKLMKLEPLEGYLQKMREAAAREDGKSQLGIARVRYESKAELNIHFSEEKKVTVTAKYNLND